MTFSVLCYCPIDVHIERHNLYRFVDVFFWRYVSNGIRILTCDTSISIRFLIASLSHGALPHRTNGVYVYVLAQESLLSLSTVHACAKLVDHTSD